MATGRHWEWRAFGQAPHPFVELFDRLPLAYPEGELWLNVTDDYLWVPDCRINVKLRRGIEDGLKLKRFEESKDGIELWREDSKELYPYAKMDEATFSNLADALRISLPPVPAAPWDRDKVIAFLELAEPRLRLIRTEKKRQTRRLGEKPQALLIEIAELTAPERIVSLGLEDDFKLGPDAR